MNQEVQQLLARVAALEAPQPTPPAAPGAWSKIETKAKALVEKNPGLTIEQATERVLAAEPRLYTEYRREQCQRKAPSRASVVR